MNVLRVQWVKLVQLAIGVAIIALAMFFARAGAQVNEPAKAGGDGVVRFGAMDLVLDSAKSPLGAYQVEILAPAGVEIVGLEGGDGVFKPAPFYDPKALMGRRIVVAAFSTEKDLPSGATRVARLHLQMMGAGARGGGGMPKLENKLVVATDGEGRTIAANVTLRAYEGGTR